MKKLNITKKQYDESKYFNKKYGALKFVSESGKVYKTDKGVIIALEGTDATKPTDESLSDVGAALKKTAGDAVSKVKKGFKKVGKAIGDAFNGTFRDNDRVTISGTAGDVTGKVVKAGKDKIVIAPDNEREYDPDLYEKAAANESEGDESGEVTRGELTDILQDVVDQVEKVCDAQDISFEEVIGVEPEGESEEGDADEVVATKDEVADELQGVIDAVKEIADKEDIELPEAKDDDKDDDDAKRDGEYEVDECGCQECGDKPTTESRDRRVARARMIRESIRRRAKARRVMESIRRRRAAKKVLESIRRRRAAKKVMESIRRRRAAKRVMESRKARVARASRRAR